jgi:hypothetical protein
MKFYVNCNSEVKNTGVSRLCSDMGPIAGYILTPLDFSMTEADAKTQAAFDTLISAVREERIYPFPAVLGMTDNSEDTVFEEMALGNIFVRDGKYNIQFMHESSRYKNAVLRSHSLQTHGVVFYDIQGRLQANEDGEGNLVAQPLQQFVVEKPTLNNGSDSAYKSRVTMIWQGEEWESNPAVVTGLEFNPADLEGLTDLDLEVVGTPTATEIVVQVNAAYSGVPVNLEVDDFELLTTAGVVQTLDSVTAEDGLHTFVGATLESGSLNLVKPADLVTTGYDSTGAVDITIA